MASACINNVSVPPHSSFGCLSLLSNGSLDDDLKSDPGFIDFEFRLHDGANVVPADELFSGGKLVPLHLAPVKPSPHMSLSDPIRGSPLRPVLRRDELIGPGLDSFAVSPKAPTCSSRWRELLRIKRQQQQAKADPGPKNTRSLMHFLNRSSRASSSDPSLSLPLLKDDEGSDPDPPPSVSRLSLSSSAPEQPHELPRLSLDTEHRPNRDPILLNRNPPKVRVTSRVARPAISEAGRSRAGRSPVRRASEAPPPRCASVDSPRMSASGRVVFQGLGRSSSSPSTFNGGPRPKHTASVRVTPVLNVPVCSSLRSGSKSGSVFGFFSGSGPKAGSSTVCSSNNKGKN